MFLPEVKYCLPESRVAGAIHWPLPVWHSAVILLCSGPAETMPVGVDSDCLSHLRLVGLCFLIITWLLVCLQYRRPRFNPWVRKIWRRRWQSTPVFLPGKIPWTEDPGRLQSMGSQRVRHDWASSVSLSLLLLSRFSRVRLCATPQTAAHQAPLSLGFARQEHWSGVPFPSPMHESKKWKWSRSVVSDSSRPHGLQPTRLLCPWDFPGKSTGVGCHCLLLHFL